MVNKAGERKIERLGRWKARGYEKGERERKVERMKEMEERRDGQERKLENREGDGTGKQAGEKS